MMDLFEIIKKNYGFKSVIKNRTKKYGSGNTFLVHTKKEKYITKINVRNGFVETYEKDQNKLNQMDILQSRIIKTNNGSLKTLEGIVI